MLRLRKPSEQVIRAFLNSQAEFEFTYGDVGATAEKPPTGFVVDHTRERLGEGRAVFEAAKLALSGWQQFRLGWLEASPATTPIREGAVVAVVATSLKCWWLNACRIVYVIDEPGEGAKYGFAYGTLPDHVGSGEERFLIEMDPAGVVWYDILAFSRPNRPLAKVGYPIMRRAQRRFGRQSAAHMQDLVKSTLEDST